MSKGTFAIAVAGAVSVTVGATAGGGGGGCGVGVDAGASSPPELEPLLQPVRIKSAESGMAINGYFTVVSLTN
jgi:hypothetical protein